MTYPEAIQFLYGLRLFGAKFGLENTLKLAELHRAAPFIPFRSNCVPGEAGTTWELMFDYFQFRR